MKGARRSICPTRAQALTVFPIKRPCCLLSITASVSPNSQRACSKSGPASPPPSTSILRCVSDQASSAHVSQPLWPTHISPFLLSIRRPAYKKKSRMKHGHSYPVFYAESGFFDGKNLDFWRIGSKPFLWRILKTGKRRYALHITLYPSIRSYRSSIRMERFPKQRHPQGPQLLHQKSSEIPRPPPPHINLK